MAAPGARAGKLRAQAFDAALAKRRGHVFRHVSASEHWFLL
jgi:hypothetical protein